MHSELWQYGALVGYAVAAFFFGGLFHRLFHLDLDSQAGFWLGLGWPVVLAVSLAVAIVGGGGFLLVVAGNWCGDRLARLVE